MAQSRAGCPATTKDSPNRPGAWTNGPTPTRTSCSGGGRYASRQQALSAAPRGAVFGIGGYQNGDAGHTGYLLGAGQTLESASSLGGCRYGSVYRFTGAHQITHVYLLPMVYGAAPPAPPPPPPPPPVWADTEDEEDMSRAATFGYASQAHQVWVDQESAHLFHTWTGSGGDSHFQDLSHDTGVNGALALDKPAVSIAGQVIVIDVFGADSNGRNIQFKFDGHNWGASVPGH